jgi:hypothetical protein
MISYAIRDEAMFQQPPIQNNREDEDEDHNPCLEDEEFFGGRQDAQDDW